MIALLMSPAIIALVKATLLLALGLAVASRIRSSAPALRHLILLATIVATLILPFMLVAAPHWDAPLLPSVAATRTFHSPDVSTIATMQEPSVIRTVAASVGSPAPSPSAEAVRLAVDNPATTLALIWLAGSLGGFLFLIAGHLRLDHITRQAWPVRLNEWTVLLDAERSRARVAKDVQLLVSPVASTPLTWGTRAAVILLPEDALEWPEEHRRVVLRHELAHVARRDASAQLIAGLACAVYWFHPLVWVAARRLRAECERACDDQVLASGTAAADYAAHLLEVARSSRSLGGSGILSVAMARPSQLEGRLLAILDESRRRVSLTTRARFVAVFFSALVVVAVSGFRVVPSTTVARAHAVGTPMPPRHAAPSVAVLVRGYVKSSVDTTFEESVDVRSGNTLTLDLQTTGGALTIVGWDEPRVRVRGTLAGRSWRETQVRLEAVDGGARLETRYTGRPGSSSFSNHFEIQVPRHFNVRVNSAGGSITVTNVDGTFRGTTGGGNIDIARAHGDARLSTGGGDIHVSDSELSGSVSTGGGVVRIMRNSGDLAGSSGTGDVITNDGQSRTSVGRGQSRDSYSSSSTTTFVSDGADKNSHFGENGIQRRRSGGDVILPEAPDGAHISTGGGTIRIGKSAGEVYASTGGGPIEIGPAAGSVIASTGAGDITVTFSGSGEHSAQLWTGLGRVELTLPRDISATVILESAYTESLGHKTRLDSDWPLTVSEPPEWDESVGTPRRYVRSRLVLGSGQGVIRVRAVNGNVILKRAP